MHFPKAEIPGNAISVEVAVMIDITGSMCDDPSTSCTSGQKLSALKDATKTLVDLVVSDDQPVATSRVALVPFIERIRVAADGAGGTLMKKLKNLDPTWSVYREHCTEWGSETEGEGEFGGCSECLSVEAVYDADQKIRPSVTERFYEDTWQYGFADDVPGPDGWLNAYDGSREPLSDDSTDAPLDDELGLNADDPSDNGIC